MSDNCVATDNMMPIRVLFAIGSLRLGGSQHVLIELLKGLDRRLFDPHLALLEDGGEFRDRVPLDVTVHSLEVRRARMAVLPLASLCWNLRPQVVLSFSAQLNTAAIVAQLFMPRKTPVLALHWHEAGHSNKIGAYGIVGRAPLCETVQAGRVH